jgi:fructokinase
VAPIVVTGEALFDLVLRPDGALAGHPGGGPYNVARTIGRLGGAVSYLGRLSTDALGRRLRAELAADGVGLEHAADTGAPTTLALAEVDAGGGATYRFYAQGTSAAGLTEAEAAAARPEGGTLYLGTLGLVLEPLATTLEGLAASAGPGTLVALDPNCRPAAIGDPSGYRARLGRLLDRADLVKVSEEDLAWLEPGAGPVAAARALLRDGAVALVTLGGAGAVVVTAGAERRVAAPPVTPVDTIGAGDAFMGGLLAEWAAHGRGRGDLADLGAVADAAAFACRVAAVTCTRAGADPPRRAELA